MPLLHNNRNFLIRKGTKGQDELVDKIIDFPTSPEGVLYLRAKEIHDSRTRKKYIEACLLASNDYEEIADLLGVGPDLIGMYAKCFYDVADLDTLCKLELLEKPREKDEQILKTWALHQGLPFIAWRLGKSKQLEVNPQDGLTDLFNTCIYKSKEALFNPNSSAASMESTKWVKLSLDIARLLKLWVLDSAAAKKDLELAIKSVMPDFKSLDDLALEESSEVPADKARVDLIKELKIVDPELNSLDDLDNQE
jgi:hypothetical protein